LRKFFQEDDYEYKTLPQTKEVQALTDLCKSSSDITSSKSWATHSKLVLFLARLISCEYPNEKFAGVIMMRSGLGFGLGLADELDLPVLFYDDKNKMSLR
jgi:hypothetical protein